jgi:hypothetical protein
MRILMPGWCAVDNFFNVTRRSAATPPPSE